MAGGLKVLKMQRDARAADSVGRMIEKFETLQEHLRKAEDKLTADEVAQFRAVVDKFSALKTKHNIKDHNLDLVEWENKSPEDRQEIETSVDRLFTQLSRLNGEELRAGKRYFGVFIALFVALVVGYLYQHTGAREKAVSSKTIIDATKQLRTIELEVKALADTKSKTGVLPDEDLKTTIGAIETFRNTSADLDFSAPTLQLLGNLDAEVARGVVTESDTITKLSKAASVELQSFRSSFLWTDRRGRWIEIAFWAELGTLVGILFYIAGSLSVVRFRPEEIPMFWAEVIIAPIVVLTIFFLFNFSGIAGFSLQETSITEIVGFAFIMGFAIRRTLGLLDTVKKRVFPDPTPATTSQDE